MRRDKRAAFALYEVIIGVMIFSVGVVVLGRSVENCLNASAINADENRVRQVLANRMAEVQATPGVPDESKEFKIETAFGPVKLVQKAAPAGLTDDKGIELGGIRRVTLTAEWTRAGGGQSRQITFYVYRAG